MFQLHYMPKHPGKIGIVCDHMTEDELRLKTPLSNAGGHLFKALLKASGIDAMSCPVTYLAHDVPKAGMHVTIPTVIREEGRALLPLTLSTWRDAGITTLIVIGPNAFSYLSGHNSAKPAGDFKKYRGSFLPCPLVQGLKIIPTYSGGHIYKNNSNDEAVVFNDIQKAKEYCHTISLCYPEHEIKIIRDHNEAIDVLDAACHIREPLACDIETRGGLLTAFGIAYDKSHASVIMKDHLAIPRVLQALGRFAKSDAHKIFHNAMYDTFHGAYYYRLLWRNFDDTMLMQHSAYPALLKSLGFCSSLYTNAPYWKDEGKEGKKGTVIDDKFYLYNGKDCCVTREIYDALKDAISDWKAEETYQLSKELMQPVLFSMMKGLPIDFQRVRKFADKNEQIITVLQRIVKATLGDINIGSSQQLCQLVYDQWDLPKQYNTTIEDGVRVRALTTDAKKLKHLTAFPTPYKAHLGLIAATKKHTKLRDFYKIKVDEDGNTRTTLKIHGTYTGRMASSSCITGSGTNLQNQPKIVRKFYVPAPGRIFIQMDLSQAEARFVAALCRDHQWLSDFDECDLHSKVAAMLFHIPIEQVNRKTHRQDAKKIAHGTHYLLGPGLFAELLGCSLNEAKAHIARYKEIRPSLQVWHNEVRDLIKKQHYLRTAFGRPIQFFGPFTDSVHRAAVAAEPQGTSAEYLNRGLIRCFNSREDHMRDWWFHLQVHDSILCSVPDDLRIVEKVCHTMKALVEETVDIHGIPLLVPCDFEIGYSWGEMTEIGNLSNIETAYNSIPRENQIYLG